MSKQLSGSATVAQHNKARFSQDPVRLQTSSERRHCRCQSIVLADSLYRWRLSPGDPLSKPRDKEDVKEDEPV